MTDPIARLATAQSRVHVLLGMLAEYERRPEPDPALLAVVSRNLREATRALSDAAFMVAMATPEPLGLRFPALERWRAIAIEHTARRSPLEVAAAWELTASECERLGNPSAAADAIAQALAQQDRSAA